MHAIKTSRATATDSVGVRGMLSSPVSACNGFAAIASSTRSDLYPYPFVGVVYSGMLVPAVGFVAGMI
jgi:hypothetical protein